MEGCAALIEAGCVEQLVVTTPAEEEVLQGPSLASLRALMMRKDGLTGAIAAGAVPVMIALLTSTSAVAREQAALCLAALTVELEEKQVLPLFYSLRSL